MGQVGCTAQQTQCGTAPKLPPEAGKAHHAGVKRSQVTRATCGSNAGVLAPSPQHSHPPGSSATCWLPWWQTEAPPAAPGRGGAAALAPPQWLAGPGTTASEAGEEQGRGAGLVWSDSLRAPAAVWYWLPPGAWLQHPRRSPAAQPGAPGRAVQPASASRQHIRCQGRAVQPASASQQHAPFVCRPGRRWSGAGWGPGDGRP